MTIRPVQAELFHAERQTDRHTMKLIVTVCSETNIIHISAA